MAAGLTVAGIGGLMMAGAWEPSKGIDTLFTAGAGFLLLAVAYDDNYPRGTAHEHLSDGGMLTACPTQRASTASRRREIRLNQGHHEVRAVPRNHQRLQGGG